MKKLLKILGYGLMVVLIIIIGLLTYVKTMLPNVGSAPELKVEITTEKIERGKYLTNNVMLCMDCHSTRDWSLFSAPMITVIACLLHGKSESFWVERNDF